MDVPYIKAYADAGQQHSRHCILKLVSYSFPALGNMHTSSPITARNWRSLYCCVAAMARFCGAGRVGGDCKDVGALAARRHGGTQLLPEKHRPVYSL